MEGTSIMVILGFIAFVIIINVGRIRIDKMFLKSGKSKKEFRIQIRNNIELKSEFNKHIWFIVFGFIIFISSALVVVAIKWLNGGYT